MVIYIRRLILISSHKQVMEIRIASELNLMICALDSTDIIIYNEITGEILFSIPAFFAFHPMQDLGKNIHIPCIAVEQEFLYITYNGKFLIYDLLTYEEILSHNYPDCGNVIHLDAQKSNSNGGIYFITSDDVLHIYSYGASFIYFMLFLLNNYS